MSWSRSTKSLFVVGCLAVIIGLTGAFTGNGQIKPMVHDFYPGPCVAAPSSVSISFQGRTSGCTASSGTCQAGEEIVFTATESAANYEFQECDKFVWTFGDGQSVETFGPSVSYKFPAPGPRTARLTVSNSFGTVNSNTVTVPAPAATSCGTGTDRLCLNNNRFRVTLFARGPDGRIDTGLAVPENQLFGFFALTQLTGDPNNLEIFVKVVGPLPDGAFIVFYGGLTSFEYQITVFDTVTGLTDVYSKPPNESRGGFAIFAGFRPAEQTCPIAVNGTPATPRPGSCTQGGGNLCMLNSRFRVTLSAQTPAGAPGNGVAFKKNEQLGYFSIPELTGDPSNAEVFVKMLGPVPTPGNPDRFWVFYGGLTDFQYTISVTDTTNGQTKNFSKAAGSACGGADTAAFPF
jgi:PKD repeat protein